ncbi:unnamed protein product [Prunus armeniaca]
MLQRAAHVALGPACVSACTAQLLLLCSPHLMQSPSSLASAPARSPASFPGPLSPSSSPHHAQGLTPSCLNLEPSAGGLEPASPSKPSAIPPRP